FFVLILVSINTLMLREFFASFVPPVRIMGVQLSIVLSCLFSLVEVVFGAAIAFIDGASLSAVLGRTIFGASIIGLAAYEFGFYARFGAEIGFDPFAIIWAPDRPPNWTKLWFGIFGP